MKSKFLAPLGLLLFCLLVLQCSKDNTNDNTNQQNNTAEIIQIENDMESGTWRISSYIDSGQDETHHFTGFDFNFSSNSTLSATNGNTTANGSWSVTDSNSNDDSYDDDDIDFNLSFASPADFIDLSDDWDIVMHSGTRIDLVDVSGGNGGTDTITFLKN